MQEFSRLLQQHTVRHILNKTMRRGGKKRDKKALSTHNPNEKDTTVITVQSRGLGDVYKRQAISITQKTTNNSAKFKILTAFLPVHMSKSQDFYQMHNTESRLVVGPSNIHSGGMYMCIFLAWKF